MNERIERERVCRSITYKITADDAEQKVSSFLKHKGYSTQNRVNLKKDPKSIWVNGICVFQNAILREGDVLEVQIREAESSDGILPVELPLAIVYEDEDLLVINKPAGMPIHPSLHNYDNSLGNALAWYFKKQDKPFVFRCINRLDRDTSGLTIVAKHMVSGAILSHMVAAKSKEGLEAEGIHREYLAIVEGHVTPEHGVIDAPIGRADGSIIRRCVRKDGAPSRTVYETLQTTGRFTLLRLCPQTGRTHQLRVHMAHLGYPLAGDWLYGTEDHALIARPALHSYELMFTQPITGEPLHFTAPIPEDMQRLLAL